jgi:hypothetical protein
LTAAWDDGIVLRLIVAGVVVLRSRVVVPFVREVCAVHPAHHVLNRQLQPFQFVVVVIVRGGGAGAGAGLIT